MCAYTPKTIDPDPDPGYGADSDIPVGMTRPSDMYMRLLSASKKELEYILPRRRAGSMRVNAST
jgi:hypothetical protein